MDLGSESADKIIHGEGETEGADQIIHGEGGTEGGCVNSERSVRTNGGII